MCSSFRLRSIRNATRPQVLARYADKHQADPARWYFLTGQRDRIIRLIQQGFHLAVAAAPVEADQGGMIPHSPRFVLVDKEARIRGYYDSRELEAFVRLKNHIDRFGEGVGSRWRTRETKKENNRRQARLFAQGPNWPLFILAVIGMILSGYLTVSAWQGRLAAFCAEGAGCDIVLNSRWSTLLGMPTSFWGFLTYGLLAAVAWNRDAANQWRWAWVISLFGLFYSLYLTGISFLELKAACPYCLGSLGLMATIFVLTTFQRPKHLAKFSWGPFLTKSLGAVAIAIIVLHLHYAGYLGKAPGPEDPWIRNLAEHLARSDAKFYGASWCPHCHGTEASVRQLGKAYPICGMQSRRTQSAAGASMQG